MIPCMLSNTTTRAFLLQEMTASTNMPVATGVILVAPGLKLTNEIDQRVVSLGGNGIRACTTAT